MKTRLQYGDRMAQVLWFDQQIQVPGKAARHEYFA